jgi:ABC-type uncharacterized transport system involved in gliding motility auxiliary subunit
MSLPTFFTAHRRRLILALPLLAMVFVGLVSLSSTLLRGARLDLTEHRQYTLSEGTRHIIERIKEPIRLQFFYSEKAAESLPQFRVFAQRVRELLEEAAAHSHGKITLEMVDPEPFSEAEDKAAAHGLQAVPLGTTGDSLYFGLVGTNTTDGEASMPFIQPDKEAFLEYDLAKLLSTLSEDQKPVLAVLSGLPTGPGIDPASGQPSLGWVVDRKLSELFEMRRLQANPSSIGNDVSLLMVVHPKDLSDDAQYAIDQYVLRGGHLLVFVDPDAESDPAAAGLALGSPDSGRSSDLPRLFKAWGLAFDPNKVVLDAQNALQVQPDPNQPPVLHPAIIGLGRKYLDQKDVVTADLETVNLSSAGALSLTSGSPLRMEPLMQSSSTATLGDAAIVRAAASEPGLLAQKYPPGNAGPFVLAGRLTGKLKSAFPERSGAGHLAESKLSANIMVVADTDLLADRLWVQVQNFLGQPVYNPFANNGDFVFNAVDNLVGNNDLIAVRTRVDSNRPFEKVQVMRRAAEAQFQSREQELQKQLEGLEQKLSQLQPANGGQPQALNREQQAQLLQFQQQKLATRKELRDVQHRLNARIDTLGDQLKLINILGMPLVVVLIALALAWRRRRLRQESGA